MLAPQFAHPGSPLPRRAGNDQVRGREAMIRKAAYLLARWRGRERAPQPEDVAAAERQIDELLRVCGATLDSRAHARSVADTLRS